ncbi:MAG TPA: BON domain-containing protein [Terriglobales bacterium]|nr:BON domain-containing protein [Terriglobales bacterium]
MKPSKILSFTCALFVAVNLAHSQETKPKPTPVEQKVQAEERKNEQRKNNEDKAKPSRIETPQSASEKGSMSNFGTDTEGVRQRIENALRSDSTLSATSFTVNVTDDTVEISGVANNGKERVSARRIAQSFAGNLRVRDRITVAGAPAPPSSETLPQSDKPSDKPQTEALDSPEVEAQKKAKANKPKAEPTRKGDQSEDPRR